MNQAAYDPVAVLDELIEGYVPDSTVPVSILDSYITELLAQPGGARLLASHCEPASGHTLGTALVSHRNHRLQAGAAAPTDPNDRPYGARSLLVRLLDAGVDLARPNAHGRSALVAALCWHDRPQTLTDALRIAALQPTSEVLDRLYAAPNAPCDPVPPPAGSPPGRAHPPGHSPSIVSGRGENLSFRQPGLLIFKMNGSIVVHMDAGYGFFLTLRHVPPPHSRRRPGVAGPFP